VRSVPPPALVTNPRVFADGWARDGWRRDAAIRDGKMGHLRLSCRISRLLTRTTDWAVHALDGILAQAGSTATPRPPPASRHRSSHGSAESPRAPTPVAASATGGADQHIGNPGRGWLAVPDDGDGCAWLVGWPGRARCPAAFAPRPPVVLCPEPPGRHNLRNPAFESGQGRVVPAWASAVPTKPTGEPDNRSLPGSGAGRSGQGPQVVPRSGH